MILVQNVFVSQIAAVRPSASILLAVGGVSNPVTVMMLVLWVRTVRCFRHKVRAFVSTKTPTEKASAPELGSVLWATAA